MVRTAEETAEILVTLYDGSFAGGNMEPFRIGWPELRSLAGVARLTGEYLWEIDQMLNESGYFLFPLDTFLLVTQERDLSHIRAVPPRIIEEYLPDDSDDEFDDEELELLGFDDDSDEYPGPEIIETLFTSSPPAGESAPREAKPAPGGRKGRKAKGTATTGQMSE